MNPSSLELVVQYILEHRGSGHFLPYNDYELVRQWVARSNGAEELLLILSDLLPEYYEDQLQAPGQSKPRSLAKLHRRVLKKLDH